MKKNSKQYQDFRKKIADFISSEVTDFIDEQIVDYLELELKELVRKEFENKSEDIIQNLKSNIKAMFEEHLYGESNSKTNNKQH